MSANLRNCSICGRLFAYQQGRTICSRCLDQEEEQYAIVRKYVRDHPGATVFEVAEETGVEEEIILQFLRDGRLQSRGFAEVLECQRCGKIISSGKYCSAMPAGSGFSTAESYYTRARKTRTRCQTAFSRPYAYQGIRMQEGTVLSVICIR